MNRGREDFSALVLQQAEASPKHERVAGNIRVFPGTRPLHGLPATLYNHWPDIPTTVTLHEAAKVRNWLLGAIPRRQQGRPSQTDVISSVLHQLRNIRN